jgi:hypothetical protein
VYVRIADGILERVGKPGAAFDRDAKGTPSPETMEKMKASAEQEDGPWFAVHRGYEVQIAGGGDEFHRTGSIYSLAPSSAAPKKFGEWQTMLITLDGNRIQVDLDGQRVAAWTPRVRRCRRASNGTNPNANRNVPEAGYVGCRITILATWSGLKK